MPKKVNKSNPYQEQLEQELENLISKKDEILERLMSSSSPFSGKNISALRQIYNFIELVELIDFDELEHQFTRDLLLKVNGAK